MPAPVVAAAALPLVQEGAKLAGDVVAHVAAALNKSVLEVELSGQTKARRGRPPVDVRTKLAFPAWLVVGGAAAMWILGVGLKPTSSGFVFTERPRVTFSLFGTGGTGSPVFGIPGLPSGSAVARTTKVGTSALAGWALFGPIGAVAGAGSALLFDP